MNYVIEQNRVRIVDLKVCDLRDTVVSICEYLSFYQIINFHQFESLMEAIATLQDLLGEHGAMVLIKIVHDLNIKLP